MASTVIEPENDVRRDIAIRLNILARQMRSDFDRRISDVGVTRSQWALIAVVSRRPGATQRSIAEVLEMSEASAGRLIDRLCADGLLERRERDDDRRARAVYLTQQAEPLLEQLAVIARNNEERLFAGFSDTELSEFAGFLDRVYRNVNTG
ncbi:MAG: MarR family transcriptional regulator [Sphingomonadales bacterium]|nr:MarR family transcriptional regulator [Sphingomonadales bacterium]